MSHNVEMMNKYENFIGKPQSRDYVGDSGADGSIM
jgi:hypothetical protein